MLTKFVRCLPRLKIAAFDGQRLSQTWRRTKSVSRNAALPRDRAGATNKVGPNSTPRRRHSGSIANFSYSRQQGIRIIWSEATFKDYIKDPKAKIAGTKMMFAGIKNEQEINDLWLTSSSSTPKAI